MPRADKQLLARVHLAWPTVILAAVAFALWLTGGALVQSGHPIIGMLVAALGAYLSFTPLHDATHQAVGRARWLNAVVGRISAVPLWAPFAAFRFMHLEHHKHTNDPARDPDHYSGRGPRWQLPLRWMSQDLHYYALYLRAKRARREQVEVWGTVIASALVLIGLVMAGYWEYALFGIVLPARLATGFLAFAFDYLPHRPHDVPSRVNRFEATVVRPAPWLTPLLVGQNFHLIHHLYPAVPFYRYGVVWRSREADLRARGARVIEPKGRGPSAPTAVSAL